MGRWQEKKNAPIKSAYRFDLSSSSIVLGEEDVDLIRGGLRVRGKGKAKLSFQPRLSLTVWVDFSQDQMQAYGLLSAGEAVEFSYGIKFERVTGLVTQLNFRADEASMKVEVELMPNPQRMLFLDEKQSISSVICHIVNFPQFLCFGSGASSLVIQTSEGSKRRIGGVCLRDDPWIVELQELEETKSVVQRIGKTGGYGITHLVRVTQVDGKEFDAKDVEAVIQRLYFFLSFARGAWAPPVLMVGFNADGSRVLEDWGLRLGVPWEHNRRWFDLNKGEMLSAAYPGFMSLLREPFLGPAVSNALYWYLRSNRGGDGAGIDSGVILTQAALEKLSFAYLEAKEIKVSKGARTAEILRIALDHLEIPTSIPLSSVSLELGRDKGGWKDGPEALTRIRNELVHPKRRLPVKLDVLISDAWNLGQWYVELMILKMSGYNGEYSSRLKARWVGEVENVPWAPAVGK